MSATLPIYECPRCHSWHTHGYEPDPVDLVDGTRALEQGHVCYDCGWFYVTYDSTTTSAARRGAKEE